jgi:hypothetical protein
MNILPQTLPQSKPIRIPKKQNTEFKEEYCEDRDFPNNNKPNPNKPFKSENLFDKLQHLEIHTGSFQRYQLPAYIKKIQQQSSVSSL